MGGKHVVSDAGANILLFNEGSELVDVVKPVSSLGIKTSDGTINKIRVHLASLLITKILGVVGILFHVHFLDISKDRFLVPHILQFVRNLDKIRVISGSTEHEVLSDLSEPLDVVVEKGGSVGGDRVGSKDNAVFAFDGDNCGKSGHDGLGSGDGIWKLGLTFGHEVDGGRHFVVHGLGR